MTIVTMVNKKKARPAESISGVSRKPTNVIKPLPPPPPPKMDQLLRYSYIAPGATTVAVAVACSTSTTQGTLLNYWNQLDYRF